jgi:hypothetical protein
LIITNSGPFRSKAHQRVGIFCYSITATIMGLAYVIALFSFEAKNLNHGWKRMRKGHATIDTYKMTEPAARLDSDRDMQLREAQ